MIHGVRNEDSAKVTSSKDILAHYKCGNQNHMEILTPKDDLGQQELALTKKKKTNNNKINENVHSWHEKEHCTVQPLLKNILYFAACQNTTFR